ncbi:MAG: bifunctional UDP-N-acetylglucosamine diphosphorylase/glucosamine-1-phosphate N-acetyltransferase GlmU [Paracoccaceae bacterium]
MPTALIVLAAGQGTRMNSDLPKMLHKVGGLPLFAHALSAAVALEAEKTILIVGHGAQAVSAAAREIDPDIEIVEQSEQRGTGHAVAQARSALADSDGDVVVLYGDTPFVRPETLQAMTEARKSADIVVLGFQAADPARYGRLVMQGDTLQTIVEYKDATAKQRTITFCNSGIKMANAKTMFDLIDTLDDDNASGEIYLTDIVAAANTRGLTATAVTCDEAETLGVNSRADLVAAEAAFQTRARANALENGVTLIAPDTVFFSTDTLLGRDTIVEPNVIFGPDVTIETGATIRAFSHLESCHVGSGAIVGPFTRLRPGAEIANGAHIGNFVEIKNAQIGEGTKVNHLSYIGDATLGRGTNIGAGTITCNYDGVNKHRTEIGARTSIGSNTMLIAPVKVGDEVMTASATVISKDIPDGALAISRPELQIKPGLARKLLDKFKAIKAAKQKGA